MPSRKQRRRRQKSLRHEWEYVEVDPETGEERTVAPAELKPERPERKERAPAQARGGKPGGRQQQRGAGSRRTGRRAPQPPSWQRVWKRTALFAPLMALFIYWTQSSSKGGVSVASIVLNTAILIAFFAPFSYLVDTMTYRIYTKRTAGKP
jgi:hypothetical protein